MNKDNLIRLMTIDQGNSSAKVTVWEGFEPILTKRFFSLTIEDLLPVLEETGVDSCAFCTVGHKDAKFLETLRRMLDGRLMVLTPSTSIPIRVAYGSRDTLGNDRVATAVAAAKIVKDSGSLVVDAGTAMTIDVVDGSPTFLGGNIAPGVRLRLKSLHEATENLPLVEPVGDVLRFGNDTVSAIRAGVISGMASEIEDVFHYTSKIYGVEKILLTGNDAEILYPLLADRVLPVKVYPDLVGYGLVCIFHYNQND